MYGCRFLAIDRKTVRKISVPTLVLNEILRIAFMHAFMVTPRSPSGWRSHTIVVQQRGVSSKQFTPYSRQTGNFSSGQLVKDSILLNL